VVTTVAYQEEQYPTAERCVAGIRRYVDRGWEVSQLRGPVQGPFVVLFRIEDRPDAPPAASAAGAARAA
jgi:hypothetical protein